MEIVQRVKKEVENILKLNSSKFYIGQNERFLRHIRQMHEKSALWRDFLAKHNIKSKEDLPKSLDEIHKLPIMDKDFLLEWTASKENMLDSDQRFMRIHTCGTSGKPTDIDYSKKAAETGWGWLGLRTLLLMGINPEEKGIMLTSYNEKTRASHSSHVNTLVLKKILGERLIDQPITRSLDESLNLIVKEKVRWIGTVPLFYNASIVKAKERGIELHNLGIKTLFYGGVEFPEDKKKIVQEAYNAEVIGFYPSTELCAAGTQLGKNNSFLKAKGNNYLLYNDYIIFEILNENNNPVKIGEIGRVIATPLFMDGVPLVRYDIGDQAVFHGYKNNFMLVSDIKRSNAMYFTNVKFHFYEVEDMQRDISERTKIPITALQVAKVVGNKDIELPVLRVETKDAITKHQKKMLAQAAVASFRRNYAIDTMIERGIHGGIHQPVVEFYKYKELVKDGSFKPKLASDETDTWGSYAFFQSKVQHYMSPIRQLADCIVHGLNDCNSVADFACGTGYFASRLAQKGMSVDAVDLNPVMLHYARKRVNDLGLTGSVVFHEAKVEDTGIAPNSKDGVNVCNILCHIDNPDDILNEAKRILKHNGKLTLSEPRKGLDVASVKELKKIGQEDMQKHPEITPLFNCFAEYNQKLVGDIKPTFSESEMKSKLEDMGFDILETQPVYANLSYFILSKLMKRAEFKNNILDMSTFSVNLEERSSSECLLLDLNERTTKPSQKVVNALKDFIERMGLQRYSHCKGINKKIAKYAQAAENETLLTNGSYHAIDMIFRAHLKEEDTVIIPKPAFDVFHHCANMQGASVKEVYFSKDGSFPLQDILSAIDKSVKLIVICNPNNPTGTLVPKKDIEELLKLCRRRGITLLLDEAYYEFSGQTCADLIKKYPNLIITRTFSKAFGLASLRAGYIISNEANIEELAKLQSPFDVNILAQVAVSAALDDLKDMTQYAKEVMQKSKPLLESFFVKNNIAFYPSSANFLFVKAENPNEVCRKFREKGIFVSAKEGKHVGEGLRVTIGSLEQTKQFICVYKEMLKDEIKRDPSQLHRVSVVYQCVNA
jgi:histidinol-phosphate aminotransferase